MLQKIAFHIVLAAIILSCTTVFGQPNPASLPNSLDSDQYMFTSVTSDKGQVIAYMENEKTLTISISNSGEYLVSFNGVRIDLNKDEMETIATHISAAGYDALYRMAVLYDYNKQQGNVNSMAVPVPEEGLVPMTSITGRISELPTAVQAQLNAFGSDGVCTLISTVEKGAKAGAKGCLEGNGCKDGLQRCFSSNDAAQEARKHGFFLCVSMCQF